MPKHMRPRNELLWSDLWPAGTTQSKPGWAERLLPGVHVLVDGTGEEAAHWLGALSGQVMPASGRVQCMGVCGLLNNVDYQQLVYWHHPRSQEADAHLTAMEWLSAVARTWHTWSDAVWLRHCQGFALEAHLDKPLAHLSTGSRRKLGLAAALACGAPITLIEEPTAGLDSSSIRYLQQALDHLGMALSAAHQAVRWVIVAHWEPLAGVTWDEVLKAPSLVEAAPTDVVDPHPSPVQRKLL